MSEAARHDAWRAAGAYEQYMGRWSRQLAPRFLEWLDPPTGKLWVEVGCGTGALTSAILQHCAPTRVVAVDQSADFLAEAEARIADPRVAFVVGDAVDLPVESASADVVASMLVLNFVPDRPRALAEMKRVARAGALVGFAVWDYPSGGIEFMRAFWAAAATLDPAAAELSEGRRFPFCTPEALADLAHAAGLRQVHHTRLTINTRFRDFADFWTPFTLGAGPAPGYCAQLAPAARERLRAKLEADLPRDSDGSIPLRGTAHAVKGVV